jgi:AcrR family transcriptional regulator
MQAPTATRKDIRRESILAVAKEVFFKEGYQAASMSAIAARLGGSKATLYTYFPSKEVLFEAYIREQCGRVAADILDFTNDMPVAEVLTRFGQAYLDHLMSDWAVRTFQIIVAESRRTPELAALFFDAGPRVGRDRLAGYIQAAVARGELVVPDPEQAAREYMALCRTHHLEAVLNLAPKPTPRAIAAEVASAVAMFLARYGQR